MAMTMVSVSEIVRCHFCPVRYSLERKMEFRESPAYTVAKQVSSHLGGDLDGDSLWEEVEAILPGIDPSQRAYLDTCVDRCRKGSWRIPVETDLPVRSDRFGIRGMVDKVFDGEPPFAITRPTEPPSLGVHAADRIRVAALALCVTETLGIPAPAGAVEYIPSGEVRICTPEPRDRRAVLRAAEAVRRIREGTIPKRPLHAPCDRCPHKARCQPVGRPLSDLLKGGFFRSGNDR